MNIRQILRENLLLQENVKQAEKILKTNNIPLDDPAYLELRSEVESQKMIGYLGPIVAMSVTDQGQFNPTMGSTILNYLTQHKQNLNMLPKPVHQYTRVPEFLTDIDNITKLRNLKKLGSKLSNPQIKDIFANPDAQVLKHLGQEVCDDISYFVNKMDSSDQKELLVKSNKFRDEQEFLNALSDIVKEHRTGFNFGTVMRTISGFNQDTIEIRFVDKEKQLILAQIKTYEGSQAVGSKSWCIVGSVEQWNEYTRNAFQYFLFNFNAKGPEEKMIAFTLDENNKVTASHDRYDGEFPNPIPYLSKLGIRDRVFTINSRLRAQRKTNDYDANKTNRLWLTQFIDMENKVLGKKTHLNLFQYEFDAITYLLKTIADEDFSTGDHLDLLFQKFQNLPVKVYRYGNNTEDSRYISNTSVNAFILTLHNFDSIHNTLEVPTYVDSWDDDYKDEFQKPSKETMISLFTKALNSQIPLQQDTRRSIAYFLKDNGVDLMRLSQQAKEKRGEELTDTEVAHLGKQGYDLKPRIQNKLAAIRRGEDAGLNTAEINYAIDNGFADVIRKYYEGYIPQYAERQLSYEDMQVYTKLGMLDKVAPHIIKKGNMYGLDALNSIESSIYSHYSRT